MSLNNFSLTEPQKAILSTEQFFPNTSISNICGRVVINSKINQKLLEKAINIFVEKNKNIRFQLNQDSNGVTQYEKEYIPFSVDYVFLTPENRDEIFNSISRRVFTLFDSLIMSIISEYSCIVNENSDPC